MTSSMWAGASSPAGRSRVTHIVPLESSSEQLAGFVTGAIVGQPSALYTTSATTTAQITGLTAGRTYRAQVRAVDAAGNASDWSTEIVFTASGTPAPATITGAATIPTPGITIPGPTPATIAGSVTIPAPAAGFERSVLTAGTTGTVTGLTASRTYTARVRARDAAGNWSAFGTPIQFTTAGSGTVAPAVITGAVSFPTATIGGTPPTVTAGRARPCVTGQGVSLDVTATPPGGQAIIAYQWEIISGGGSLTNATTATPTWTAPGSGSGTAVIRARVSATHGGQATANVTVSYAPNIVAAENALTGTPRATWDLSSPNLGGVSTLLGFVDGFTVNRTGTVNFKIAQSDTAGWDGELFRLGWYGGDGARSYGTLTPSGGQLTASQAQPSPGDADPNTTLVSADCANWSTTLTWTPPSWAPSGIYILKLNRTGGGTSHVMFILRDDARAADIMFMTADSTWLAYNAFGGMGGSMYSGNSFYYGTSVDQYNADAARLASYNKPFVNRGAADAGRSYGAVEWSTFFTGEYPMLRFLERNGFDTKYYGCIDASGDAQGTHLLGDATAGRGAVKTGMFVGHNEYWSSVMRTGWERAKNRGVNVFSCAGNEVFWRTVGVGTADSEGRPRTYECYKSTIAARGSTGRPEWTGTWRDPDGAGKGGNSPENTFTGTIFVVNGPDLRSLVVPFTGGYSAQPLWRHTSVAALSSGQYTSGTQILGFEWDTYGPAGTSGTGANYMAAPHPRAIYCSNATYSIASGLLLTDAGDEYLAAGNATHRLVVHPGGAGAITFGTGTVNWSFGVDNANTYQQGSDNSDTVIQQATVNMLVDMGATPASLMGALTMPTPVDWYPDVPTTTIAGTVTIPAPGVGQGALPAPATIAGAITVTTPTIIRGAGATPATVTGSVTMPAPTIRLSVLPAPATIAGTVTMPAPAVQTASGTTATPATVNGSVTISAVAAAGSVAAPAAIAGAVTMAAPTVRLSVAAAPATITGSVSMPAPALTGTAAPAPATITGTVTIGAPTLAAGNSPTPQAITGTTTMPAPTIQAGATPTPAGLALTATIGTPTITAVTAPSPATITGSASFPAPGVTGGSSTTPTPATLAGQATIAAVTVLTSLRLNATTITGAATIPGPAVRLSVLPAPGAIHGTVTIGAPSLILNAAVTVPAIHGSVTIGQISHTVGDVEAATGTATVTGVTLTAGVTGDTINARVS